MPGVRDFVFKWGAVDQGGASTPPITYIFRDTFPVDEASPIASPRAADVGSWTVTQTAGVIAVVGGKLELTGNNQTGVTSLYSVDTINLTPGRALFFERLGGTAVCRYGLANSNAWGGTSENTISFESGGQCLWAGNATPIGLHSAYAIQYTANQKRVFGRTGETWKLLWIEYSAPPASLHVTLQHYSNTKNIIDDVRIFDLEAPWVDDYGIITVRAAAPADGAILAAAANALITFKWTPALNETLTLLFRRTDDDNCWKLVCDQAGGTIKLYKREGGADTEVDAGKLQTWTAGTPVRLYVRLDGQTIMSYVNRTRKHNYTTAAFNETVGGAKVSGFTTGVEFDCWPGNLPPF